LPLRISEFSMWNKKILTLAAIALTSWLLYAYLKPLKQPHLTVIGPLRMADGIGRQAGELIEALKDEVDIHFIPCGGYSLEGVPISIHSIVTYTKHPKFLGYFKALTPPLGKVVIFEDVLDLKGHKVSKKIKTLKNKHEIRIAYSMYEASQIPPEWVETFNAYFDAIAVPDRFLQEVYLNSGVNIPIFELPLGLNLNDFLEKPLKSQCNVPFVFGNLSSAVSRKNQLKLIRCFYLAFGNSSQVKLRINSRYSDPDYREDILATIEQFGMTNVEFTEGTLDKQDYLKIFEGLDCYVSLSTGEGFSIQPREAMALGIPTLLTDNTAQTTLCKSHLTRAIPCQIEMPAFNVGFNNTYGVCYDCTEEEVVQALLDMYENYDKYLQHRKDAREWVQQYCYNRLNTLYLTLVKPQQVILGKENKLTDDALITTSPELVEKYQRLLGIHNNL